MKSNEEVYEWLRISSSLISDSLESIILCEE